MMLHEKMSHQLGAENKVIFTMIYAPNEVNQLKYLGHVVTSVLNEKM